MLGVGITRSLITLLQCEHSKDSRQRILLIMAKFHKYSETVFRIVQNIKKAYVGWDYGLGRMLL